jgi:hypothetical protein
MAAIDGECSPDARRELDALLGGAPDLAAEWRRMTRVKEVTTGMRLQSLPEEAWDGYWTTVYRRAERGAAWLLISAGAIVLAAYWLWHAVAALFEDTSVPALIRFAIVALGLGLIILLVSVLREKMFTHRRRLRKGDRSMIVTPASTVVGQRVVRNWSGIRQHGSRAPYRQGHPGRVQEHRRRRDRGDTKLLAESREQSIDRMMSEAKSREPMPSSPTVFHVLHHEQRRRDSRLWRGGATEPE